MSCHTPYGIESCSLIAWVVVGQTVQTVHQSLDWFHTNKLLRSPDRPELGLTLVSVLAQYFGYCCWLTYSAWNFNTKRYHFLWLCLGSHCSWSPLKSPSLTLFYVLIFLHTLVADACPYVFFHNSFDSFLVYQNTSVFWKTLWTNQCVYISTQKQ